MSDLCEVLDWPVNASQLARRLAKRLTRDCDFPEWPGGPDNAGLAYNRRARYWRLGTLDGQPCPTIHGPAPLERLLNDGFVAIHQGYGDEWVLMHVEEAEKLLGQGLPMND